MKGIMKTASRPIRNPVLFLIILLFVSLQALFCQDRARDAWQQPDAIMDSIGIHPGMIIGEAGAGSGYFTFHLASRVGPDGMIYANDIDEDALEKLEERQKREEVKNITTIFGEEDDPLFPGDQKLDIVVMMNVFHHIEHPVVWMKNVIPSMKPGAPMVFIETDPGKRPAWQNHFLTREEILSRMKQTRFKLVHIFDFLERDNIYLFSLQP